MFACHHLHENLGVVLLWQTNKHTLFRSTFLEVLHERVTAQKSKNSKGRRNFVLSYFSLMNMLLLFANF